MPTQHYNSHQGKYLPEREQIGSLGGGGAQVVISAHDGW